jgi:hypothetical protein
MTVDGSLFHNNTAHSTDGTTVYGGAIYVQSEVSSGAGAMFGAAMNTLAAVPGGGSASFTVTNSTFYQSTVTSSGGVYANGGAIAVSNTSTGLVRNDVTLTSLTVYQNTAPDGDGGGLWLSTPTTGLPQVRNSIIAGNTCQMDGYDVFGHVNSQGFNLIGDTDGSWGWLANDQKGTNASPLDPGLDPQGLGNWGGQLRPSSSCKGAWLTGAVIRRLAAQTSAATLVKQEWVPSCP